MQFIFTDFLNICDEENAQQVILNKLEFKDMLEIVKKEKPEWLKENE